MTLTFEQHLALRNETKFAVLGFRSLVPRGGPSYIVVAKGRYEIVGRRELQFRRGQAQLIFADQYYGDPRTSSLRLEGDLAPIKPVTDIYFDRPRAYAHGGQPRDVWEVGIRVGTLSSFYIVTGPRKLEPTIFGSRLGPICPTAWVAMTYENTYGGATSNDDGADVLHENPVGCGAAISQSVDDFAKCRIPQVGFTPAILNHPLAAREIASLGAVARAWMPRRGLAGTFDDHWKMSRWPAMPDDFNLLFFNTAPKELRYPELMRGGEIVDLAGLHPAGPIQFQMPDIQLALIARNDEGREFVSIAGLDTVLFKLSEKSVEITWRVQCPLVGEDSVDAVLVELQS